MANLSKLSAKKKGPAPYKAKSPKTNKTPKAGKVNTTWDPFTFNGKGAQGKEAEQLERTAKLPAGMSNDDTADPNFTQYVPDTAVIGNSSQLQPMEEEFEDEEEDDVGELLGMLAINIISSLSSR